ncbi:hypothetical protein Barb4_04567 [Bacteroidales bacterium Barb4]|nr:hypothetical protein Barb4_04567 [Bacteroidales bacterium Barb4]
MLRKEDFVKFSGGGGGGAVTMATDSVLGLVRGTRISNKKNEKGVGNIEYNIHIKEDGEMSVEELSDDIDELWDAIHKVDSTGGFQRFVHETGYVRDSIFRDSITFSSTGYVMDEKYLDKNGDIQPANNIMVSPGVQIFKRGESGFTGREYFFTCSNKWNYDGSDEAYCGVLYEGNDTMTLYSVNSMPSGRDKFYFEKGRTVNTLILSYDHGWLYRNTDFGITLVKEQKPTFNNIQRADSTHDGFLRKEDFMILKALKSEIAGDIYAVGAYYITDSLKNADEVGTYFAEHFNIQTKWVEIADRFLYGAGANAAGSLIGSNSHTHKWGFGLDLDGVQGFLTHHNNGMDDGASAGMGALIYNDKGEVVGHEGIHELYDSGITILLAKSDGKTYDYTRSEISGETSVASELPPSSVTHFYKRVE